MVHKHESQLRRKLRIRSKLQKKHGARSLRLSVFRSNRHIYVQLIDDVAGKTVAAASTVDKEIADSLARGSDKEAAKVVGALIAKRAKALGIEHVVFDRGSYIFHGRVKALADAARENGLSF